MGEVHAGPEEHAEDNEFRACIHFYLATKIPWTVIRRLIVNRSISWLLVLLFVVPASAMLLQRAPEQITISPFSAVPAINLDLKLPFSWAALYFSALGLLIARVLYNVYCPEFLLSYESAAQAIREQITPQMVRSHAAQYLKLYYAMKLPSYDWYEARKLRGLLKQYRAGDEFVDEQWKGANHHYSADGVGTLLSDTIVSHDFVVDSRGNYVLPPGKVYGPDVERTVGSDRLLQHICWDLIELQKVSRPACRVIISLLLAASILILTYQVSRGVVVVMKAAF